MATALTSGDIRTNTLLMLSKYSITQDCEQTFYTFRPIKGEAIQGPTGSFINFVSGPYVFVGMLSDVELWYGGKSPLAVRCAIAGKFKACFFTP